MKWLYSILAGIGIIALIVAATVWFVYYVDQSQPAQTNDTATTNATANEETQDNNTTVDNTSTVTADNSDAHSCDQDTITFCSGIKLTKINRVNCLLNDHYDEISDACRNSLERRQQLNEELVAACEIERAKFCKGVEPEVGAEPMVDCLEENYAQLSPACATAFDAHDAAKLTN